MAIRLRYHGPMRVGLFVQGGTNPRNVSGFRFACEDLLRGLAHRRPGPELVLFALGMHAEGQQQLSELIAGSTAQPSARILAVNSLADAARLRGEAVDVLHELEHHLRRPLAARAALARPVPIAITTHGNRLGSAAVTSFYLPLLLAGLGPADRVICASSSARDALLRHLDRLAEQLATTQGIRTSPQFSVAVIPFGIDTEQFRPQDRLQARATLGLAHRGRYLLCHGRIDLRNKQDPSPLLLVLRRLRRDPALADLRLLVSTSPFSPELDLLRLRAQQLGIAEHVDILQGLPRSAVPAVYAASNVAVCLSDTLYENFGLTAIEAMACAVPVIAADWAGFRDTVQSGETGWLIPTRWAEPEADLDLLDALDVASAPVMAASSIAADPDALEHALRQLLESPELAARMGQAGRRRVEREYSTRTMIDRHLDLWAEMREHGRAAPAPHRLAVPLFNAVGHYPSRCLADHDRVTLTVDGRALLGGGEPLCTPPIAGEPTAEAPLYALLGSLGAAPLLSRTVAEVLAAAEGQCPGQAKLRRHLLWLHKQGYVRIEDAKGRHSRSTQRPPTSDSDSE